MKTLMLLSGGLDSTCFMMMQEGEVEAMCFDYGQRNRIELASAINICNKLSIPKRIIHLESLVDFWEGLQITDKDVEVKSNYDPSIVVPLRNGIFLMIAMAYAYQNGFDKIALGCEAGDLKVFNHGDHEEVYYPDCSNLFMSLMQKTCSRGVFKCIKPVRIDTPAMHYWTKVDLIKMAYKPHSNLIFKSWSCYANDEPPQCGKCKACLNRQKAFEMAGITDRTEYVQS